MALYTIGEVALLCDINPVTLRAWQRRYGLLKPQRTDGGHRLFNDDDIEEVIFEGYSDKEDLEFIKKFGEEND